MIGKCQRIEVVDRAGNQLAHLVDKQPDPDAAQDGPQPQGPAVGHDQQQHDGPKEQQPAPQRMRQVERLAAHLGEAGQFEVQADKQHRRSKGGDQHQQQAVGGGMLHRRPHTVVAGGMVRFL